MSVVTVERSWEKFWNWYVCVCVSVYVQHASAVNYRGRFSSVVNCSRFLHSSTVNYRGAFPSFTCVSQPNQMCNNNFLFYMHLIYLFSNHSAVIDRCRLNQIWCYRKTYFHLLYLNLMNRLGLLASQYKFLFGSSREIN